MNVVRYQHIDAVTRQSVENALARGDSRELSLVVLGVALHEPDSTYAQELCTSLATHPDPNVRGNAILGFGHIARLHRVLDLAVAAPLVREAMADGDSYVRGHAESAADDIETFLGARIR